MKINPQIFKNYDIRGKYPQDLNEKVAYKIGRAFVDFIRKEVKKRKIDILLGQDNRLSSPMLFKALSKGIVDSGANVISLGLCSTPMFYFSSAHFKFGDGGIMITASHCPRDFNGFKLVKAKAFPVDKETGLQDIKKRVLENHFPPVQKRGKVIKKDILKTYVQFNLENFNLAQIAPLKIVVDTGNGVSGIIIPEIFRETNCKVFHLFSKLDGRFPNRSPDFLKKGSLKSLQEEVRKRKADLGLSFDGDGDRIIFVDEKAKIISPNSIFAFVISQLLKENPGEKIIYTVRASRIIPEVIKKNRGEGVLWRIGHSVIKRKMRKENILFGGETSNHYYHKRHYFSEAPFFVLFKVLEELSKSQKKISQLTAPFQKYYYSGEIEFRISNFEEKIEKVQEYYKGGKENRLDGLRVDFKDWWFLIRPSGTEEGLLKLVVEAERKDLMEQKKKELTKIIST